MVDFFSRHSSAILIISLLPLWDSSFSCPLSLGVLQVANSPSALFPSCVFLASSPPHLLMIPKCICLAHNSPLKFVFVFYIEMSAMFTPFSHNTSQVELIIVFKSDGSHFSYDQAVQHVWNVLSCLSHLANTHVSWNVSLGDISLRKPRCAASSVSLVDL